MFLGDLYYMLVDVTGPRLSLCKADLHIQVVLQMDFVYSKVYYLNRILSL